MIAKQIHSSNEWEEIKRKIEKNIYAIIFKTSPRCPISLSVEKKFDEWLNEKNDDCLMAFKIDVIKSRDLSLKIAEDLKVKHESPQCIVLNNALNPLYFASHYSIDFFEIDRILSSLK